MTTCTTKTTSTTTKSTITTKTTSTTTKSTSTTKTTSSTTPETTDTAAPSSLSANLSATILNEATKCEETPTATSLELEMIASKDHWGSPPVADPAAERISMALTAVGFGVGITELFEGGQAPTLPSFPDGLGEQDEDDHVHELEAFDFEMGSALSFI